LMVNRREGICKWVDTLAITMVAVYLAQIHQNWQSLWNDNIQGALDFISGRLYEHEIEGYRFWHFNGFYPPDWEDTSFAIYLLWKNGRLERKTLEPNRKLLIKNTTELGTGVWVKDPYLEGNAQNNHWDPTSAINTLRLHYILETEESVRNKVERFVCSNLTLAQFAGSSLYYTAPLTSFFAQRLILDFPDLTGHLLQNVDHFRVEVRRAIENEVIAATPFERALLGLPTLHEDNGLIFHHGRRTDIWYGSPILCRLTRMLA